MHLYIASFPALALVAHATQDGLVDSEWSTMCGDSSMERYQPSNALKILSYHAPIAHARRDPLASALRKFATAVRTCGLQLSLEGLAYD